jgi:hypothetical protein
VTGDWRRLASWLSAFFPWSPSSEHVNDGSRLQLLARFNQDSCHRSRSDNPLNCLSSISTTRQQCCPLLLPTANGRPKKLRSLADIFSGAPVIRMAFAIAKENVRSCKRKKRRTRHAVLNTGAPITPSVFALSIGSMPQIAGYDDRCVVMKTICMQQTKQDNVITTKDALPNAPLLRRPLSARRSKRQWCCWGKVGVSDTPSQNLDRPGCFLKPG